MDISVSLQSAVNKLNHCKEKYENEKNDLLRQLDMVQKTNEKLNESLKQLKSKLYNIKRKLSTLVEVVENCRSKKKEADLREKLKLVSYLTTELYRLSIELTKYYKHDIIDL